MYTFMSCDYSASGEGRTVCLLITRAYPRAEDYTENSRVLKNSTADRGIREFTEEFGGYLAIGAQFHSQEEFLNKYKQYIPEFAVKMLNSDEQPGNFNFKQAFHFNFS